MDMRTYLNKHRECQKLKEIILQVVTGLRELHGLGFVHRDLKPENIVLNIGPPLKIAIIDFNRSLPTSNTSSYGNRGTPGYQPNEVSFIDGSINWDIYSLVAIMLECDMGPSYFNKVT